MSSIRAINSNPGIVPPWLGQDKNPGIVPPWLDQPKNPGIVPPWLQEPVHILPVEPIDGDTAFVPEPAFVSPTSLADALRAR